MLSVWDDRHYQGRTFVALINLNAENKYKVTIRARKAAQ